MNRLHLHVVHRHNRPSCPPRRYAIFLWVQGRPIGQDYTIFWGVQGRPMWQQLYNFFVGPRTTHVAGLYNFFVGPRTTHVAAVIQFFCGSKDDPFCNVLKCFGGGSRRPAACAWLYTHGPTEYVVWLSSCVCTHVLTHTLYIYMYIDIYVYIYMSLSTFPFMHACLCRRMFLSIYIYRYIHIPGSRYVCLGYLHASSRVVENHTSLQEACRCIRQSAPTECVHATRFKHLPELHEGVQKTSPSQPHFPEPVSI